MKSLAPWGLVLGIVVASPSLAAAQAGDPAAARTTDAYLELRVTEELVAEGIVLARLGVALDVETAGEKMSIALVDVDTGAARAATKLEPVPADPEAAVASVVQVVATLVQSQLVHAPSPELAARPVEDAAAVQARVTAQRRYDAEAISFRDEVSYWTGRGSSKAEVVHDFQPYLGGQRLDREQFYEAIERPDLTRSYHRRRTLAGIGWLVASVSLSAAAYFGLTSDESGTTWRESTCLVVSMGTGLASLWLSNHSHPIDDREMQKLAHEHNEKLRAKYRLPRASATLAPFVTAGGAGVALGGGF